MPACKPLLHMNFAIFWVRNTLQTMERILFKICYKEDGSREIGL